MTAIAKALERKIQSLRNGSHAKRALIFISNRFRGLGPATVEHVQNSGCTLMTLGFTNKTAIILSVGDLINKRQFMRESGGRRFSAETDDITGVSPSIVYSLKNYYSIGYQTKIIPDDEKPRHIKVSIKKANTPSMHAAVIFPKATKVRLGRQARRGCWLGVPHVMISSACNFMGWKLEYHRLSTSRPGSRGSTCRVDSSRAVSQLWHRGGR